MWKRLLNSAVLATTTHRKPEGVSEGTSTQVATQVINKYRTKIVQEGLYNRRDLPWIGDQKGEKENIVAIQIAFVTHFINFR